ncbi:hypothetical protein F442_12843 [Phytophthora nicotianae P10297]|uniref:Uncharacterized protein n=1 Tax=Phytophthora nicotianae P10297 TaxID=1317064 RepID=W2Z0J5_PHYNI|nr:hypothetical protein F442_12843 [Phytophthora nicotianae P10297]
MTCSVMRALPFTLNSTQAMLIGTPSRRIQADQDTPTSVLTIHRATRVQ